MSDIRDLNSLYIAPGSACVYRPSAQTNVQQSDDSKQLSNLNLVQSQNPENIAIDMISIPGSVRSDQISIPGSDQSPDFDLHNHVTAPTYRYQSNRFLDRTRTNTFNEHRHRHHGYNSSHHPWSHASRPIQPLDHPERNRRNIYRVRARGRGRG
eukprot:359540_1